MAQAETNLRRDAAIFRRRKSVSRARAGLPAEDTERVYGPWCSMRYNLAVCLIRRNVTRVVYVLLLLLSLRIV